VIQLRMRGFPPALVFSAVIAAWPLGFVLYEKYARHAPIEPMLIAIAAGAALLPWLSRVAGRLSYRAAVDDIALHVGGDALPWNTITRVRERRSWRRTVLIVERGRTSRFVLVTRDLFAGRLEPIEELRRRLPAGLEPS
jgi:hypothetical protein